MENEFEKNCSMAHNYENLKKFEIYSNELHKLFVNSEIKQYPSCIQNHSDAISRHELKEILKEVLEEKIKETLKEDFDKIYKRFDELDKTLKECFDRLDKRLNGLNNEVRELNNSLSIPSYEDRMRECIHLALSGEDDYFINCDERWLNKPLDDWYGNEINSFFSLFR